MLSNAGRSTKTGKIFSIIKITGNWKAVLAQLSQPKHSVFLVIEIKLELV